MTDFFTGLLPFLSPNQQCQSKGRAVKKKININHKINAKNVSRFLTVRFQSCEAADRVARKTEAGLSAGMIQAENPTAEMCKQPIQIMHSIYEIASDVVLETRVLVSRRLEDNNESLGLGLGS